MVGVGTPRDHPSTKAVNKLAKAVKINFIGTLEASQDLQQPDECLIKKKETDSPEEISVAFSFSWPHARLPGWAAVLKMEPTSSAWVPGAGGNGADLDLKELWLFDSTCLGPS